ncbi:MAG: type IV pilus assembly protein PilN [Gammaproteobacteria bacterium]
MANINLLPWREELRRRRQKDFLTFVIVAVVGMLGVVGVVHWEINNRVEFQQTRNDYLKEQIAVLDTKIKEIKDLEKEKQDLLARMEIIEALQTSRPEIVHLMDELVKTLPEGVYYTEVKQIGRNLDLKGVAQSNARVSSLMRNVDKSDWLERPNLVEIRKLPPVGTDPSRFSAFSLQIQQKKQKVPGQESEEKGSSS